MSGFEAMAQIHRQSPDTLVIMITGDATIESAVEALKSGAYNYLRKPFQSDELLKTIKNALDYKRLQEERKQSEKALRESEERFRALVENSLIGICIVQNNKIVYQNSEQSEMYKHLPKKSLNKLINHVHPDDVEKVIGTYRSLLSGKAESVETDFRIYPLDPKATDAEMKWIQCGASLFQFQGEEAILVNIMDITRAKELENMVRVKSKMVSLGRVAAGIAHEIRNPLTGINSYIYTLEDLLDTDVFESENIQIMKNILGQIQVASNKIESVIKSVLDFSRPGAPSMGLISLNQSLEAAMKLSAVSLRKKGIKIEKSLESDLPQCYGDTHLIEQVILNLFDNAVKAMGKNDASKLIMIKTYSKDKNIYIQISDSGSGIPLAIRDKIFDPFFTTETDGSGIGLAISQRIVNDHNGSIKVDSSKWGGAEFTIELPIEKRMNPR
jgi:PAS domain S-box-containing protein